MPPRIAARTQVERAAVGYLHGNCGHCHSADAKLGNVGLFLRYAPGSPVAPAIATTVGQAIKDPAPGQGPDTVLRIDPGHPERSGLAQRMASRWAAAQMPPLGTELVDADALDLVRRWISELEASQAKTQQGGTRG